LRQSTGGGRLIDTTIVPWKDPGWLDDASAWIDSHVGTRGHLRHRRAQPGLHVVRAKPWSVVVRVRARGGVFWFKELGAALAQEPPLTKRLAQLAPQRFPQVPATEGRRMLTLDAGPKLAKPADLNTFVREWSEIITGYAELQMQLSSVAGLPAPDSRPQTLARRFGAKAEPLVATLGDAIPQSLVHLDVTHKNVCIRAGRAVFIDWGEAAIGHPFCGLVKPLRALVQLGATPGGPEILRVRDAYLEPWTGFGART
jgi:hypothetical protein